ncbi:putative bifunctional diguanylate cyclase/phosphodiesterase [Pseudothauera hydrothermalis]|jgi:diguanylate cyclase (GGDEF)-like protein|uniref:putative bifunctional diguanylate cyclase/phosphodiesterase n=1 Tax=Pseudothauera hydrothermalis TaxID=2184083 RepID=UPI000E095855|nr:GGDEF domain-containing protein [Pseudothauera hydrothermalis]
MMQIYRKPPQLLPAESAFFRLPGALLMILDEDWIIQMMSESWRDVLGMGPETLRWRRFTDVLHELDQPDVVERLGRIGDELSTVRFSCRCRKADGRYVGLVWSVSYDPDQGLFYASAHETAVNLSDHEARLPEVFIDGLTGLPNRALFLDRVNHAMQRAARRKDLRFAVIHCGVDRFSVINHSLGNRIGDLLLIEVANLLRRSIRPTDMVARLGGDEFGILLEDIRDATSPLRVIRRLQDKLVLPFQLHEHEVFSSLSSGVALSGEQYEEADAMLRDANMAMRRAKVQGGGGYVLFDRGMHEEALRRLDLELDLRRALEKNQFEAYYQPIVRVADGRLMGFEALVRWNHPERGLISPVEFIPLAEENGLIVQIGRWMLAQACAQMRAWQRAFPRRPALTVSVNLSARQLLHPDVLSDIRRILRQSGLSARHLKLEITESAMMEDAERAIELLLALKRTRLKLMLDDFGTGYSSLSYLHRLPIDALKVDRSFIMHMHARSEDRSFVEMIVNLAQKLGRSVVCEGVELPEQEAVLRELGVDFAQGFLYSRPVTAAQAEMLIIDDAARFARRAR